MDEVVMMMKTRGILKNWAVVWEMPSVVEFGGWG